MSYLLDTNVVSELRKRSPDPNVTAWYDGVQGRQLFLSVLTLGEIRMGIEQSRRKDPVKADVLGSWLNRLLSVYHDRIVGVDTDIADAWARMQVPDPLPVIDGLLAATASVRNWTFVTRNVADVGRCGVRTLNPFDQACSPPDQARNPPDQARNPPDQA
ncbi:MAG: type II toxin-antitoxin system VapC family toxin [Nocardiopsaceae bacterium]|nr:type II toxin-antitoxin system VapC family toxin [Nocardiopsaceae bacterium]